MTALLTNAAILRSTEKAHLIEVSLGDVMKKEIWFPKSQVEITAAGLVIPGWLLDQKNSELENWQPNLAAEVTFSADERARIEARATQIRSKSKAKVAAW
jgi:hypothetical protein